MLTEFQKAKAKAKAKYKDEIRCINHWEKIDKKIKKQKQKGVTSFEMTLPHNSLGFDDEFKITAYAEKYGYEIEDENIGVLESTYYLRASK